MSHSGLKLEIRIFRLRYSFPLCNRSPWIITFVSIHINRVHLTCWWPMAGPARARRNPPLSLWITQDEKVSCSYYSLLSHTKATLGIGPTTQLWPLVIHQHLHELMLLPDITFNLARVALKQITHTFFKNCLLEFSCMAGQIGQWPLLDGCKGGGLQLASWTPGPAF